MGKTYDSYVEDERFDVYDYADDTGHDADDETDVDTDDDTDGDTDDDTHGDTDDDTDDGGCGNLYSTKVTGCCFEYDLRQRFEK